MSNIKDLLFEDGYLVVIKENGARTKHNLKRVLRAADVPDLNIDSLTLLTKLAQVMMVVVKTLIEKDILSEELVSGFDMQYVLETLVDDLDAEEV